MVRPDDYDYELPVEQIARTPGGRRSGRMLVLGPSDSIEHRRVAELPELLASFPGPPPLMVLNDSRVVPARIRLRGDRGRRFELLVVDPGRRAVGERLEAWVQGAEELREGEEIEEPDTGLRLRDRGRRGRGVAPSREFEIVAGELLATLEVVGELPVQAERARPEDPRPDDPRRHQSVFARALGSVAAPTAGLHLDEDMLAAIDHVCLTLHVGPGTFLPMESEDVRAHELGAERYEISEETATRIERARAKGRPILAVGSTVTRTLETVAAAHGGRVRPGRGRTDLVITPEHRFAVVDRLMTNLHLPRSSLLMMVSSFAGRELVLDGYREAVHADYRFHSYGDSTLSFRRPR
jgi:S-adenosylmethionine:tRNA ribosyltransferase-isomerase